MRLIGRLSAVMAHMEESMGVFHRRMVGRSNLRPLVPLGSGLLSPYTRGLSTWSSSRGLTHKASKPDLEGGFLLRCFQLLSLPDVATLRCTERCNRITRGQSNPILSY